ncbi:hypothetical protein UlMin_016255 [Ulmus minor]
MENGYDGKLGEKLSGLRLDPSSSNNNDSSLFQVMKAVEAAEATIKQQVDENTRLRTELQQKILLLDKYKSEHVRGPYEAHHSVPSVSNQQDMTKSVENASAGTPHGTLVLRHDHDAPTGTHLQTQFEGSNINGTVPAAQTPADNAGFSSPSTTSFSPGRLQMEGEYESRINLLGQGLMPMSEINNPNGLWKQDLIVKIREREEEIMQLRKHLADYSVKEAQIRNEKHVLEKRISYMRLAFDQQQQDLVDAASKALSYRQDIIEENIRLTYALQDAQQERSTFVSSLLPLLAEYSLQPPVPDAQSIVSNVKVLFRHLQEKLFLTESKLKESQYQLTPWRSEVDHSNVDPASPSHSIGAALAASNKNGLELVPQPAYSQGKLPVSASDDQIAAEWDVMVRPQSHGVGQFVTKQEAEDLGRYSPIASRTSVAQNMPEQVPVSQSDRHVTHYNEETANKQVTFREPVSNSETDDQDADGNQNEREKPSNWSSGNPPYTTTLDDPSSTYSPFLPPVLEEPSSSFSEAADDDPLPAIEGLQISGEAYPGRELQANGYSINGTTSCNFEWVRYLKDGSVNYIDGAKQPSYLVTADDVDSYLAIEVQPLDKRKRKGELVRVFANDNKRIACDPEMQSQLEKALNSVHASYTYKVGRLTEYLDIWEQATLTIKREACIIKSSGSGGGVYTEKFSPDTIVTIPYGSPTEFSISGSGGAEHVLKAEDNGSARDTIVLTLRLFIQRAGERRKRKKRVLFFKFQD